MAKTPPESPSPEIDDAIKTMMRRLKKTGEDALPPDIAVKVINTAIAWEKVKHHIKDEVNPFDPDNL